MNIPMPTPVTGLDIVFGYYRPETHCHEEIIIKDFHRQGFIYKNYTAYKNNLDEVCYIPELSNAKYTHQDILNLCDGIESIAYDIFYSVDWQHPETLIEEYYSSGELADCESCKKPYLSYGVDHCPFCHKDD